MRRAIRSSSITATSRIGPRTEGRSARPPRRHASIGRPSPTVAGGRERRHQQRRQPYEQAATSTQFADWKQLIVAGQLDHLEFWGELKDGRLIPHGLLGDQAAMDDIPVGMYLLETDGTLVAYNKRASATWGRTPSLNRAEKYSGAHVLRYPSGAVMPHEHAPPAVVIRNGGTVRNADVICEQPDGERLLALVNIFPIRSAQDEVIGAVNLLRHNAHKTVPGLIEN